MKKTLEETIVQLAQDAVNNEIETKVDAIIDEHLEVIKPTIEKNLFKSVDVTEQVNTIDISGSHSATKDILKLLKCDLNVLLLGPTGSGKTHASKQIAEMLGLDFYYTNSVLDEFKLVGFKDASGTYQSTPFYEAFTKGGLFLFDEIDASIPEALLLLNMALANDHMPFPNGMQDKHPDFKVVATANSLDGATHSYTGRADLDLATLDRFAIINFEYDEDLEMQLINSYLNNQDKTESLYGEIRNIRKVIAGEEMAIEFSTRKILNLLKVYQNTKDKKILRSLMRECDKNRNLDIAFTQFVSVLIN